MIKCMSCKGDMIYLGRNDRKAPIHEVIGDTYNYKCSKCGELMWSSVKEKSKYKWYKPKKFME